jgi:4-aminobutyrate aminotransferase-like enzyme
LPSCPASTACGFIPWPGLRRRGWSALLDRGGRGFIWALDFGNAGGPDAAAKASRTAFETGLLVERCGRDDVALKIMPPITIDDAAMDRGCAILAEVCGDAM